eukprot:11167569-Lingulodinium_polyedra.AAC.1
MSQRGNLQGGTEQGSDAGLPTCLAVTRGQRREVHRVDGREGLDLANRVFQVEQEVVAHPCRAAVAAAFAAAYPDDPKLVIRTTKVIAETLCTALNPQPSLCEIF